MQSEVGKRKVLRDRSGDSFSNLKGCHDDAFREINQAILLDEKGHFQQAKIAYQKGIDKLEKSLSVSIDMLPVSQLEAAKMMKQKMKFAKVEAQSRIMKLSRKEKSNNVLPTLPSYDEACHSENGHSVQSNIYPVIGNDHSSNISRCDNSCTNSDDINNIMDDMLADDIGEASAPPLYEHANVLLYIEDVQVYFISASGNVSAPSYPAPLQIISSIHEGDAHSSPALLQVGSWTYPLLPGKSPTVQSDTGCYIFPDISSEPGAAVGLILPAQIPIVHRQLLEELMADLTAMKSLIPSAPGKSEIMPPETRTSQKISNSLSKGGEYLSYGLCKGAEKTSQLMKLGASKLIKKLSPEETPSKVDPRVQQGLKVTKDASAVAVVATGYVLSKIGEATFALGRMLAPHIEKHGSELLSKTMGSNKDTSEKNINDVMEVASGGIKGFSAVYMGLADSAKILAASLKNETVQVVGHKYGGNVASATNDALSAAINFTLAADNVHSMGIKSVAKRVAKDTGKAYVNDYVQKRNLQ